MQSATAKPKTHQPPQQLQDRQQQLQHRERLLHHARIPLALLAKSLLQGFHGGPLLLPVAAVATAAVERQTRKVSLAGAARFAAVAWSFGYFEC